MVFIDSYQFLLVFDDFHLDFGSGGPRGEVPVRPGQYKPNLDVVRPKLEPLGLASEAVLRPKPSIFGGLFTFFQ